MPKQNEADRLDKTALKVAIMYANETLDIELPDLPALNMDKVRAALYSAVLFNRLGATETAALNASLRMLETEPGSVDILTTLKLLLNKDAK